MKNKMLLALLSLSLFSVGSMQSTVVYEDDNSYDYNDDSSCCRRRRSCRSCHRSCRSCYRSCCPRYYNSYWYGN